jgi:hypothetical protein
MTAYPHQHVSQAGSAAIGARIPFSSVTVPGAYVCDWDGLLLRVPQDGVAAGREPAILFRSRQPLFVTRISGDPFVPLSEARRLAADLDLMVNF